METWFKASHSWRPIIEAVQVDRVTEASVFIGQSRASRFTQHSGYYPTWQEAHDRLMRWADSEVKTARLRLDHANSTQGNVKGMKP